MKKFFSTLMVLAGTFSMANAADLLVSALGGTGVYTTIGAAITAANAGDRIIVQPVGNGTPYNENLVITKSLQLISSTDQQKFFLNGGITISPALAGVRVDISGVNLTGNISTNAAAPTGNRCEVKIVGSRVANGNLLFDQNNFDLLVAGDSLDNGRIVFRYGNIIGNRIRYTSPSSATSGFVNSVIAVNTDLVTTGNDIKIIGNNIVGDLDINPCGNYTDALIRWETTNHACIISNNYLAASNKTNGGSGCSSEGYILSFLAMKASGNVIENNLIYQLNETGSGQNQQWIALLAFSSGITSSVDLINNLFSYQNGITIPNTYVLNGNTNLNINSQYNMYAGTVSWSLPVLSNINAAFSANTINLNDGSLAAGSAAINAGSPATIYTDLDLTRNDIGAYGGSFSLDNFHPMTSSARVFMVNIPRNVATGSTINISADGYDR